MAGWAGALLVCSVASAQHSADYETPTYVGAAAGIIITGQDGFYIPVPDSQDGLVYTYAGNALGLPQNPTGRGQFVGVTGGDPDLPVPFARAQRDLTYGDGTGVWTVSFDIAATYIGVLPSAQNIGSFSTQVFPSDATFIALARWTDPDTAANWNADYVWFDAAGTQLLEEVADPGFQNLLTNHWYRWCTTVDLDTNEILAVSITDLTSGVSATHNPVGRYQFGGAAGAPTPTGFRYFGGSSTAAGNTLGFDNLNIEEGQPECVGVVQAESDLDIKPGSCPNSFNRGSHGVLPVALVGTPGFDVEEVDLDSLLLVRKDGVGGAVPPLNGPPGPHSVFEDVATPFEGNKQCDCHDLGGDGTQDLSMKFRTDDVVAALELDGLPNGELVSLTLLGALLDGTPFSADDCVRLVGPGGSSGEMAVSSNIPGRNVFVDAFPLDDTIDGGGFTDFVRTYTPGTQVTLTASQFHDNWHFVGWYVQSRAAFSLDPPVYGGLSLDVTVSEGSILIEAIYVPLTDW